METQGRGEPYEFTPQRHQLTTQEEYRTFLSTWEAKGRNDKHGA